MITDYKGLNIVNNMAYLDKRSVKEISFIESLFFQEYLWPYKLKEWFRVYIKPEYLVYGLIARSKVITVNICTFWKLSRDLLIILLNFWYMVLDWITWHVLLSFKTKRKNLVMCESNIGQSLYLLRTCYTNSIRIESIPQVYLQYACGQFSTWHIRPLNIDMSWAILT